MITHVKIIAILHIVMGALGLLAGITVFAVMGGIGAFADHSSDSGVPFMALGWIGGLVFVVLLVLSLPSLIAGIGLLQLRPWARILTIVLSALHLLNIPFGTALGVYGLWALLAPETTALFQRHNAYPVYPPPAYPPAPPAPPA